MQSLLLTVTLCVLVAVLQAQDDLPFLSEEEKSIMPQPGTLEVETTVTSEGECLTSGFRMQRTEEPGQYSAYLGLMLFYIYELPVKDHYIICLEHLLFGKKFQIVDLIGKHPKGNLEVLEEFKEFIQRKGLLQENVILPEQREHCVPEHDSALQGHNC